MTRRQRRAHVWAWAALGVVLSVGVIAGLIVRDGTSASNMPKPGAKARR
jgi:hypothetical protein